MFSLFLKKNEVKELTVLGQIINTKLSDKKELCDELDISRSSLERYVENINSIFDQEESFPTFDTKGSSIKYIPDCNNTPINILAVTLLAEYLSNSLNYQLLMTVILKRRASLTSLLDELSVSESYLLQHISTINKIFKKNHIQLRVVNKQVYLDGRLPDVILFSYLAIDSHNKIFHSKTFSSSKHSVTNIKNINPNFLNGLSLIQLLRAESLQKQAVLFQNDIQDFTYNDSDVMEILKAYTDHKELFSKEFFKHKNNDMVALMITQLTTIVFTPSDVELAQLRIFMQKVVPNNQLVKEAAAFTEELVDKIDFIHSKDLDVFKGGILFHIIYQRCFSTDYRKLFKNEIILEDMYPSNRNKAFDLEKLIHTKTIDLNQFPLIKNDILKDIPFFHDYLMYTFSYHSNVPLKILVDFESDIPFEYALKHHMKTIFSDDYLQHAKASEKADIIVSDKLYYTHSDAYFMHYPKLDNEELLARLFSKIGELYIRKNYQ
ncbi:hypothetical protein G7081_05285 [Vagococcus coleopterorum]|uniref:Mga helix-turn-helix domain-containing protein n=1 Tax=Vagococcus coleopterorum TaxID=2714946 RepID=A0A6G8ANE9_9ENTE|nr:helix-turn-helix domain-containing protein [Vagococcus coleopterorum]QIL46526.1 hypothetical protein G7081_05285 [Vagococcus coleopterorum]